MPERIQLRRTKGWRIPANTVKVDRTTRWGNHIRVGEPRGIGYSPWTAAEAVEQYRDDLLHEIDPDRPDGSEPLDLSPLRGKNLACWCRLCSKHADGKPFGVECADCAPCHADPLGEIANQEDR